MGPLLLFWTFRLCFFILYPSKYAKVPSEDWDCPIPFLVFWYLTLLMLILICAGFIIAIPFMRLQSYRKKNGH